ncbi:carbohydrate-binding protein [Actinoplanes sp. NPDC049118]|uniref:carbohydrate-binding protein n=1 Tax=Actinoplanes sp. NPDC049118 TaxID=3155769 RepID=UPI0033C3C2C8
MTTPPPPPPGVYRSRSRVTRNRLGLAAAGLALVLLGYLIGRLQGGSETPAVAALPPASAPASAPASTEPAPEPSTAPPTTEPAAPGRDAYSVLQAEAASGQQGTDVQETEDEGGGQNVGWISNGDLLRFDDVDFGDTPATRFAARIAADADEDANGRIEIRIDSPANPPVGTLTTGDTDGWQNWTSRETEIKATTGRHTVFLVFAADEDDEFLNLNYFAFAH